VNVLGVDGARKRADELLASALERLAALGAQAEPLREIARRAVRRDA
jgi:hypothetical protein